MDSTAPIIFSRPQQSRADLTVRVLAAALALACLVVLATAAYLPPSHAGVATHRQLGLPECSLLQRTGLPCPSCGMTTSFSWFVRGNLAASLYVQPMGALLAFLTCCGVSAGFYVALTARPVYRLLALVPARYLFVPLLSIGLLAWVWKIAIHLSGHDGW
jgi:hypothetical protein